MPRPVGHPDNTTIGQLAAEESWAKTVDRPGRTAAAREAFNQRFLDEADGDPVRAEHLRRAHFKRLQLRSAQARRKKATAAG